MKSLPLDQLRKVLSYDPETGVFLWLESRGPVRKGSVAGNIDPDTGYLRIRVFGALLYAHRMAWAFMTGEWPSDEIDHRSTVKTDNRWGNLRLADQNQNAQNCKVSKNNKSGLKGAYYYKRDGIWVSEIMVNRRKIYLGRFGSPEAAHAAYCKAATELHGDFARHG